MFDTLRLDGEAHARGVAHGRALAPRVRAHLTDWLGSLTEAHGVDGERYARDMLSDTDFKTALQKHTPDLLHEVCGIAQGAELDPDLVFALQLLDEEWAYRARRGGEPEHLEKCSSIAIAAPDGPTWIGQNMDLGVYTDFHQVMLDIAADSRAPAALVLTTAGMIGLLGVNAAQVGVCVNSLPQLPNAAEGTPVAFVIRRLLQARGLAQAADWVQSLPHATNQHFLIAEPGSVRSFEASAAGVTEYHSPDPTRVFHTNHPLSEEVGAPETEQARENSVARLASLTSRLAEGGSTLEALKAALSSFDDPRNPVCRVYDAEAGLIGFTTGSMISELRPGAETIDAWASPGPPSRSGYTHLELTAERRV